jgi:hypothetical protein
MTVAPFDVLDAVGEVRRTLGMAIFQRIAGPDGAEVRRRLRTADDRWFPIGSPITRVHADATPWRWPASTSTPDSAAIRGAGWRGPATSSP